jgi:uncharacterized membrane protein YccC
MRAVAAWVSGFFPRRGPILDAGLLKRAGAAATPALAHGLRLSASVSLALFIAFWFQLDDAYWAGTSAGIVIQPALGASVRKGVFRAVGTIVGGVVIVTLTAIFPQDHMGLLLTLSLWAAVCGFIATLLPNFAGYAASLAGYTAAIVFAGIITNPENVFIVAVWRTTEISIGIFSAQLVHSLTDFGDARLRLGRALSELGRALASGVVRTLRAGQDELQRITARRELIGRVSALDATIDEAIGEPTHLRYCRSHLQVTLESLFDALSAWRGIGNRLGLMSEQEKSEVIPALLPPVSVLADREWLADPLDIREICTTEASRAEKTSAAEVSARLLVVGVVRLLHALEAVANALVVVATADGRFFGRSRVRLYVPDFLPAVLNAVRIAIAVVAAEVWWVATSWPDGANMITFTAVGVILFSALMDNAYANAFEFAVGSAIAGLGAVILNLAILPSTHEGFLALSFALALVLVPLGALAAGSWHKTAFTAAVTNVVPILAIENETTYDAARLLNAAVAICAGTAIAAISIRLIPPLTPAKRTQRLLTLTLRDLRRLVSRRRRFSHDEWLGLVSRRLAAMPQQATLEEQAELLAALSIGEASIALLGTQPHRSPGDTVDQAFARLASANVAEAHAALIRFAAQQPQAGPAEDHRRVYAADAAVQATLIADALARHPIFFSQVD